MNLPLGRLAALGFGVAALAGAAPAHADVVTQTYAAPGQYTVIVPNYVTSLNAVANGAAGTNGGNSSNNRAGGGPGGLGAEAIETIPFGPGTPFSPGDILQVNVSARG